MGQFLGQACVQAGPEENCCLRWMRSYLRPCGFLKCSVHTSSSRATWCSQSDTLGPHEGQVFSLGAHIVMTCLATQTDQLAGQSWGIALLDGAYVRASCRPRALCVLVACSASLPLGCQAPHASCPAKLSGILGVGRQQCTCLALKTSIWGLWEMWLVGEEEVLEEDVGGGMWKYSSKKMFWVLLQ